MSPEVGQCDGCDRKSVPVALRRDGGEVGWKCDQCVPGRLWLAWACRFGDRREHSIPIGVFTSRERAVEACQSYKFLRGGKYEGLVTSLSADSVIEDLDGDKVFEWADDKYEPRDWVLEANEYLANVVVTPDNCNAVAIIKKLLGMLSGQR